MLTKTSWINLLLVAIVASAALRVSTSPLQTPRTDVATARTNVRLDGEGQTLLPSGLVLLTGGSAADGVHDRTALWNPTANTVTPLRLTLSQARAEHTATLLGDGRVLVLGGVGSDGEVLAAPEVLDLSTLETHPVENAQWRPRAHHTTTVLSDGRVLSIGGHSDNDSSMSDADIWEPTANVVTGAGQLRNPRGGHTAALQPDGTVRVSGGAGAGPGQLPDEWFDPSQGVFLDHPLPGAADANAIAASMPPDGSTDVGADIVVTVRFTTPMQVQTLNALSVVLRTDQRGVRVAVVPVEGGRLVFVRPEVRLEDSTQYTLSLDGVVGANGQPLAATRITFTTATPADKSGVATSTDDETWAPNPGQLQGEWRTGRPDSPWQKLPPLQAAPGVTAVSGQVLLLNGKPLADVTLSMEGRSVHSDRTGRFLLQRLTAGRHVLRIDGRTASGPQRTFGLFDVGVYVRGGHTNVLWYSVWMPVIDTRHAVAIASPTQTEVVVTTPYIPGLELHIPPGTMIRDIDGQVVKSVSITPIPIDRPPYPLLKDVQVPIYFTIQPGGAILSSNATTWPAGARVVYPNYRLLPAGRRVAFWQYDAEEKDWFIYGKGTVTLDRRQIVPDDHVALYRFTGAMVSDPSILPPKGPEPGDDTDKDGEPVDLSTGQFVLQQTDLSVPDVIPLAVTRTYRPQDTESRAFGIGGTLDYDMFMVGDTFPYTYQILVLPDGGQVRFDRISPGTGYGDAVYRHLGSPSRFYGAVLEWNTSTDFSTTWQLTLKDGTNYYFPDAFGNTDPYSAALTAIRDRNGNEVRIIRDGWGGEISSILSPNGRWIHPTYDAYGRIAKIEDQGSRTVGYTYDASGRLWKVTDPNGGVTEYTYDAGGRLATIKDPRGHVYLSNQYDPEGHVAFQTLGNGGSYQFGYTVDGNGNIVAADVTNPRGFVRHLTFDSAGYTLTDTRAAGTSIAQTVTYSRQADSHQVLSVTDALNRVTSYAYDEFGDVTTVTRLAGTSDAVTTTLTYDSIYHEIESLMDPLGHTTTYTYDSKGNLTGMLDPNGNSTTAVRGAFGRVVSITDGLGNQSQMVYDGADLHQLIDPLGRVVVRDYDVAGRLARVTTPLGRVTSYEYDALGRPSRVTDPIGGQTVFSYDANGSLLSVTDARNRVTSYSYGAMNRTATRTDPLQRTEAHIYDLNGNLTELTDRKGQVTTYSYDALDRLSQINYADSSTSTFTYDAGNRLVQISDSIGGTISRAYDLLDRMTSETTAQGAVTYNYDAANRRTSMTVFGQPTVTYTYDDANRLTSVMQGASVVAVAYDNADRRTSLTLPNGVSVSASYNAASRITGLTYTHGEGVLGNVTYDYDADGKRIAAGGTWARSALPAALSSALYDDANQVTSRAGETPIYDANGNLTSNGTNTYAWNARNQLIAVQGALSAAFTYDGLGRRVEKSIGGTTIDFLYAGPNAVQELSNGSPSANLLLGLSVDEVFARTDSQGERDLLTDALGSTIALSDATGTIQTEYTYSPFGETSSTGTPSQNPVQFAGRENDGTGLYYNRNRFYDPVYQRFMSEDPLGFAGGDTCLYGYVGNDPISFTDPLGLDKKDKHCEEKWMLVTSYNDVGPGSDWRQYRPNVPGGPVGSVGPGTVAVANTNPIPYPYGSTVAVLDWNYTTPVYEGTVHDTGAGWNPAHHNVGSDEWIDIWLPGRDPSRVLWKFDGVTSC